MTSFGADGVFLLPPFPEIGQFGARAIRALPLADGRIVVVSAVATDSWFVNAGFDDCA